jgi:hypothetical protein
MVILLISASRVARIAVMMSEATYKEKENENSD